MPHTPVSFLENLAGPLPPYVSVYQQLPPPLSLLWPLTHFAKCEQPLTSVTSAYK